MHIFKYMLPVMLLLVAGVACSVPGLNQTPAAANPPSVAISSPTTNDTIEPDQEIQVQSVSVDPEGVVRVELIVNGQVIWVDGNANPQPDTPFIVAQPWTPDSPGTHTIQVRAYNRDNVAGQTDPLTVEVVAPPVAEATPLPTQSAEVAALTSSETATPLPTPTAAPTDTPAPTDTATPALPSATPTQTGTATATPAPQDFDPTGLEPAGRFKDIWLELDSGESRLGYPVAPAIDDRNYARQRFEKGVMFWWDNPETPDYIWVIDSPAEDLRSGATSNLYPDTWEEADGIYSCAAAQDGGPVRGFGKVWCTHPELESRLGRPVEPERGSGGNPPFARVQFFQGGVMFYSPIDKEVFVLFSQGDWQRFNY